MKLVLAVAVDCSPGALAATRYALRLHREAGGAAALHLLNVQPTMTLAETLIAPRDLLAAHWGGAPGHAEMRESLEAAVAAGVEAHARILNGDPTEAILRVTAELQADLLLAGTRSLGAARELLIGSVARGLVQGASCPVILAG
ncbi:MAG TPA: universal stress protein [Usitatibacter sp.]|nr:universal stress protein [Usitatibacter sp.]